MADVAFHGFIESTLDALLLFQAASQSLIPKIERRLQEFEKRGLIKSGAIFIFNEKQTGIKRWTDGLTWSPSRTLGNFLVYRELDKKSLTGKGEGEEGPTASTSRLSGSMNSGVRGEGGTAITALDRTRERALVGSLTSSFRFRSDGLVKKTISLGGLHMIAYYTIEDVTQGRLRTPSSLPELGILEIDHSFLVPTAFRIPPLTETMPDGRLRYRGEPDSPQASDWNGGSGGTPGLDPIDSRPQTADGRHLPSQLVHQQSQQPPLSSSSHAHSVSPILHESHIAPRARRIPSSTRYDPYNSSRSPLQSVAMFPPPPTGYHPHSQPHSHPHPQQQQPQHRPGSPRGMGSYAGYGIPAGMERYDPRELEEYAIAMSERRGSVDAQGGRMEYVTASGGEGGGHLVRGQSNGGYYSQLARFPYPPLESRDYSSIGVGGMLSSMKTGGAGGGFDYSTAPPLSSRLPRSLTSPLMDYPSSASVTSSNSSSFGGTTSQSNMKPPIASHSSAPPVGQTRLETYSNPSTPIGSSSSSSSSYWGAPSLHPPPPHHHHQQQQQQQQQQRGHYPPGPPISHPLAYSLSTPNYSGAGGGHQSTLLGRSGGGGREDYVTTAVGEGRTYRGETGHYEGGGGRYETSSVSQVEKSRGGVHYAVPGAATEYRDPGLTLYRERTVLDPAPPQQQQQQQQSQHQTRAQTGTEPLRNQRLEENGGQDPRAGGGGRRGHS